ncbi:MAG: 30S ribosomal protein S12 methylthiotransferase RimO [Bacteroidales bacterium]
MQKNIKIITLGCSKNTVDSEKLLKQFQYSGFNTANRDIDNNDIVIVNTCGFINDAKEESVNTIVELAEARKRGEIGELYVMGCLSERYRDELEEEIPEVDRYFGVNKPDEILNYLVNDYRKMPDTDRILSGPSHYAYLKVSEGCNRSCAFCAIPGIRGSYKSSPVEELVAEAELLTARGVKEIILIAQDLGYYGKDRYKKQMLTTLSEKLLEVNGIEWLRLHYLYPDSHHHQLLKLMRDNPRICNYIDMPIQHISDNMLSAMKRKHSSFETKKILSGIRDIIPDSAIRTTVITGYPGETDRDFTELLNFIREFRFERLGVFTYSHEEDTRAFNTFDDDIPLKIKKERAAEIMAVQQEISLENNISLKGKVMPVIIDREEGGYFIGRSEYDSPEVDQEVIIKADTGTLKPGDIRNVLITSATEFDLEAELPA